MLRIAVIIICFSWWSSVAAQRIQYPFSHIDISNGLSNNQVNGFFKDQKGFLWIATMSGLNRYDGYHFKVFRHNVNDTTTLSDDYIVGIMEGPGGKLWIRFRNNTFNIYDPATEKFERDISRELNKLNLPLSTVSDIQKDGHGDFLFLTGQRTIYKYNTSSGKASVLYTSSFPGNTLVAFAEDKKNQFWVISK